MVEFNHLWTRLTLAAADLDPLVGSGGGGGRTPALELGPACGTGGRIGGSAAHSGPLPVAIAISEEEHEDDDDDEVEELHEMVLEGGGLGTRGSRGLKSSSFSQSRRR